MNYTPQVTKQNLFRVATDKQVAFIKKLQADRVVPDEQVHWALTLIENGEMSVSLASSEIESLLSKPKKVKEKKTEPVEFKESHPGYYVDSEGRFFEVKKSKAGHKYAMALVRHGSKWKWTYAPGAMKSFQSWVPASVEDAAAFGKRFGHCMVCGRLLTNPDSVSAGIGPVCAGKF